MSVNTQTSPEGTTRRREVGSRSFPPRLQTPCPPPSSIPVIHTYPLPHFGPPPLTVSVNTQTSPAGRTSRREVGSRVTQVGSLTLHLHSLTLSCYPPSSPPPHLPAPPRPSYIHTTTHQHSPCQSAHKHRPKAVQGGGRWGPGLRTVGPSPLHRSHTVG